jgi:hypothetical protein
VSSIEHYECGWCNGPLGGDHADACPVAKGPVKRWQCNVVAVVRGGQLTRVYVLAFRDPYHDDADTEIRSAWPSREAAEAAMERAQRRVVLGGSWQSVRGYEVIEVPWDSDVAT